MKDQVMTRSAEIARRAIETVVTTPGCNKKQSAEGADPDIISLFYHAAEVFEPAASDTRIETDAYWVLTVIQYMGRFCGFSATIDPETLKITVQVIQKPPVYFRAVG
jgi:hypothetical protein